MLSYLCIWVIFDMFEVRRNVKDSFERACWGEDDGRVFLRRQG